MLLKWRYEPIEVENLLVEVYRNLRSGNWSIRAREGIYKGKVIAHTDELFVSFATFYVNEKVRLRVNELKRKEVHAYVIGKLTTKENVEYNNSIDIYYNPYKTIFFENLNTNEHMKDTYDYVEFNNQNRIKVLNK